MSKGKFQYWRTDEGLLLIAAWVRDGLTEENIAKAIGVSKRSLQKWRSLYPEIDDAFRRNKDVLDIEVENALHQKAVEGNVNAMIFWLKNRRPKRWREKPSDDGEDPMAAINALIEANREAAKIVQQKTSGCDSQR